MVYIIEIDRWQSDPWKSPSLQRQPCMRIRISQLNNYLTIRQRAAANSYAGWERMQIEPKSAARPQS